MEATILKTGALLVQGVTPETASRAVRKLDESFPQIKGRWEISYRHPDGLANVLVRKPLDGSKIPAGILSAFQ